MVRLISIFWIFVTCFVFEVQSAEKIMFSQVQAQGQRAEFEGSWGDPMLSVAARNMPEDDLSLDQSPMSAFEIMVSQKVALTPKYDRLQKSHSLLADSYQAKTHVIRRELAKKLWNMAIEWEKTQGHLKVNRESLDWIENMLAVSKKLYENGGLSQQAILDIQMRRSELNSNLVDLKSKLDEIKQQLNSLLQGDYQVALSNIPWAYLDKSVDKTQEDPRELELQHFVKSQEMQLSAQRWAQVPDLTVGLAHMKRDANAFGDAVTLSVSMPLPVSTQKYSQKKQALEKKRGALHRLSNYQNEKKYKLRQYAIREEGLKNQLKILNEQTLSFAKNSRDIAAKSYQNGSLNYNDLLDAELKLQKFQNQSYELKARWRKLRLEVLVLSGEGLNPEEDQA